MPPCSASRPRPRPRSPKWPAFVPAIVAEALVALPDPLSALLHPGPAVEPGSVARALVRSLGFETAADPPPSWLREDQRHSFGRVVAALRRSRVALLADPVGSGKTFVALAVAQGWPGKAAVVVFIPATLRSQWQDVSSRLGIDVVLHSHERLSRGVVPALRPRMVVIDESQHFRNPLSRRYRALAPYLAEGPVLMLSATPVVNRLDDLTHQLLLGARDDVLRDYGVGSLRRLLGSGYGHPALGAIVYRGPTRVKSGPVATRHVEPSRQLQLPQAIGTALTRLRLSPAATTANLLRGVLWRALGSSPAALLQALQRYRELLAHAEEAAAAGRTLDRQSLRRFVGAQTEQLVLWGVLSGSDQDCDLTLDDRPMVEEAIAAAKDWCRSGDEGYAWLAQVLSDGRRSIVFTGYRATVRYLRDRLIGLTPAWCSGSQAGIGRSTLEREDVLAWFRPSEGGQRGGWAAGPDNGTASPHTDPGLVGPSVLITTDVTAEGLNLQLAERVIHYDLPWTPTRLEQREGRILRVGSPHAAVEILRRDPPYEVEQQLAQLLILGHKASLPGTAGLGKSGHWLFSWRDRLQNGQPSEPVESGMTAIHGAESGILAGFELRATGRLGCSHFARVGWIGSSSRWDETPAVVERKLAELNATTGWSEPTALERKRAVDAVAPTVRDALRQLVATQWTGSDTADSPRLLIRLRSFSRDAIARRDQRLLRWLERAMRFVAGGHTAGEAELIACLTRADDRALLAALPTLPAPTPGWDLVEPRLTGMALITSFPA